MNRMYIKLILIFTLFVFVSPGINGQTISSHYVYDNNGRLRAVVEPNGRANIYEYDAAGNVKNILNVAPDYLELFDFYPKFGVPGDQVKFIGVGFGNGVTSVSFNGTNSKVFSFTPAMITATVPGGVTTGPVTITTANGTVVTTEPFTRITALTFPGTNTGPIPESAGGCGVPQPNNRDVSFNVTGMSDGLTSVRVNTNFIHSFVGDLVVTLIAPTGESHILFGRTGATTSTSCGDSSDLNGEYNFFDGATNQNWWLEATQRTATTPLTPGDYQTTEIGGAGQTNPAPMTSLSKPFNGIVNPNGIWILRVSDVNGSDTGSINTASLTLMSGGG